MTKTGERVAVTWALIVVLVAISLAAACGSQSSGIGRVKGTLELIGGPPVKSTDGGVGSGPPVGIAGVVVISEAAGSAKYRIRTDRSGGFVISVPAGRYEVVGGPNGQRLWCTGGSVTVRPRTLVPVRVDCPVA